MGSFISGGFIKPIMLLGSSNFITGRNPSGGATFVNFITSTGKFFKTSAGENFKVKQ